MNSVNVSPGPWFPQHLNACFVCDSAPLWNWNHTSSESINHKTKHKSINHSIHKMTASHLFPSTCLSLRIHLIFLSSRVGASEIFIIIIIINWEWTLSLLQLPCQGQTSISLLQLFLSRMDTSHFSNFACQRQTHISFLQLPVKDRHHPTFPIPPGTDGHPYHFSNFPSQG